MALLAFRLTPAELQPRYEVVVQHGIECRMRDGVVLRADIYRPKADGRFPVLLQRTAYNKLFTADTGYAAAARGYVVVIQDTRGRFTSDGEFYPFRDELRDGYDTVEWSAALPFSTGKVGMFGASYLGATQMLAAAAAPPHLSGIFPEVTASDYHDGWTYQGGALEQWFDQSWWFNLVQETLIRRFQAGSMLKNDVADLPVWAHPRVALNLPKTFGPPALGSYYNDWVSHPEYDDYWKAFSIEERYAAIRVPAYHVGGIYDIFLRGTLRNYLGLRERSATPAARQGQRLNIVMASHNRAGPRVGELDFGPSATFDSLNTMLRWYDYLLKGEDNGMSREKPVRIFVMGKNVWREEDTWPPPDAHEMKFFFHSFGKANSLRGDGGLSTEFPTQEHSDTYTYDPADPVPTRGGALCCDESLLPGGPFDQRSAESRSDVLVYTTPILNREVELIGPVSVELYASSSAVDTDFTAKLIDVWPSGFAQNLTDGIIRARYRDSQERAEIMNPDQVYKFSIDLVAVSDVLLAGHRLRLEVSSSNFPRFDRNLNTGESPVRATRMVTAHNTVYHDAARASSLAVSVMSISPAR